jgi:hypothetical protein
MNLDKLQHKLIAAARAHPPGDGVPYAFEQRILARVRELPAIDAWTLWARSLWRAATPCVAVMMLLVAWFLLVPAGHSTSTDMSQELENTVLAAADQEPPPADVLR